MPQMGRPSTIQDSRYQQVQMKPREQRQAEKAEKDAFDEKLVNRITGHKPRSIYKEGGTHNKIGKDEFLKLLSHQLQNQDPMKPMEQNKFAAELAQFSQLEQLTNLNSKFDKLNPNAKVEDKYFGASFLGKTVVTSGSSLKVKDEGDVGRVFFNIDKPASRLAVRIMDKNNNMVGEVWKENVPSGGHAFDWDGIALDGTYAPSGEYKLVLHAWDQGNQPIRVKSETTGKVESVFFEDGETVFLVDGGRKVYLRDVESFHSENASMTRTAPQVQQGVSQALQNVEAKAAPTNAQQAVNTYKKNNLNDTYKSIYD